MIFKIKWGDMESSIKRKLSIESTPISPVFYFEDELIHVYQVKTGYTLYSQVDPNRLDNPSSFKMEFLKDAIELVEKPKENNSLVIKQE